MIVKKVNNEVKVFGELNDLNTVIADNNVANTYLLGVGNKGIKYLPKVPNTILIVNKDGKVRQLELTANKVIVTDSNGEVKLIDRRDFNG